MNMPVSFFFEKHKIFLYKEDFKKFIRCLENVMDCVVNENFKQDEFHIIKE